MASRPVVQRVTAEELRADEAWWRIYEESFPSHEREPPDAILKSLRRGVGMAFRASSAGQTMGLATTHLLTDPAAVFLVYLAVAVGERSRGMGAEVLETAWSHSADELRARGRAPLGLLWEVDPVPADDTGGLAARRRIAFFERHGGHVLATPYRQPPVDGVSPVPMHLMFRPVPGQPLPPRDVVERLVRAVYYDKYCAVNGIDRTVLDALLAERRPA